MVVIALAKTLKKAILIVLIVLLVMMAGCNFHAPALPETTAESTQTNGSTGPPEATVPQPVKYPLFSEQALVNQPTAITEQELININNELNDILSRKSYDETGKELIRDTVTLLCRYYPNFEYLFRFLNPPDTATYLRKNVLTPLDSMVDTLSITQNGTGGGWASDTTKTVSIDLSNGMEENVRVMIHELNHMVVGKEHNIVSSKLYMPLSEGGATLHELAITGCGTYNEVGSIYMNDLNAVENWYPDPDKEGFYFRGKGMRANEYADRSCLYFKLLALTDFETMRLFEQPDGELLIREELGKRYGEDGLQFYDSLPFAPDFNSFLDTEPLFLKLFVSRLSEVETPDQMLSYLLLYRLYRMAFAPEYLYYEVDSYEQMHPLLDYSAADGTVAEAVVRWGVLNGEALSQEDTALAALILSGRTLTKDNTEYWERHTREFYNPLSPFSIVEAWYTAEEIISIRCISQYPYPDGISYFERELAGDLHKLAKAGVPETK